MYSGESLDAQHVVILSAVHTALFPADLQHLMHRPQKLAVVGLTLLLALGALLEVFGIGAIVPLITVLANPAALEENGTLRAIFRWSNLPSAEAFLAAVSALLLLFFVLKNVYLYIVNRMVARFVFSQEVALGTQLLERYLQAPYTFYLQRGPTELLRVMSTEVARVIHGVFYPWFTLVAESLVLIVVAAMLLVVEPLITVLVLTAIGSVGGVAQWIFRRRLAAYRDQRAEAGREMFRWANHGLGAFKALRIIGGESHFALGYEQNARRYGDATQQFTSLNSLPRLAIETMAMGAMVLVVLATILADRPVQSVLPLLGLFALATLRVMPSTGRILGALNSMRFNESAATLVAEHLKALHAERLPEDKRTEPFELHERVGFDNVSYRHPGMDRWILRSVTWSLNKGESVALVGRSGAGKTTVVDLLMGLADPVQGRILIDGRPLPELRRVWQRSIGFVPQDVFVLDDSIRRNVALGLPDDQIDDDAVWRALSLAHLDEHVRRLPSQLKTPAGDRGATFSGGERQRLGIARALYHNPEMLIFDEATSALDLRTERDIGATMRELMVSKTVLVIAHRLSTIRLCSRVVFIEDGTVAASGSFDELTAYASFRNLVESGSREPLS